MKTAIIVLFLLLALPATATTWAEAEVEDPFAEGFQCEAHEPMSYGGYIYHWHSKYDQVFWPFTDPHAIWHCPESGYTAFMTDFNELSEQEKTDIQTYLEDNYTGAAGIESELQYLEDIYALRDIDEAFANKLLRIFARWHQNKEEYAKANEYRRRAFLEITDRLNTQLSEGQTLEYLYLAANYSRFFGNIADSDEYIQQLLDAIENLQDEELTGFADYLSELVQETQHIKPGDTLDPVLPQEEASDADED